MTTTVPVPRLFAELVDDAGLFPPEKLPMAAAVARHRADRAAGHPVLTHRFLCPAGRLSELLGTLSADDRCALGLITELDPSAVKAALGQLAGDPRIALAAVEGPLPPGTDSMAAARQALTTLDELPPDLPGYVELPLTTDLPRMLAVLAHGGRAAKVRCGGLRPGLFPDCEELGAFVHACATSGVPFKATAGLHHAVRYRDERTGFTHHGFLNLLLAVCRTMAGGTADDAVAVLRSADAVALATEARQVPPGLADAARTLFVGYGSCSTSEPLADLESLGLVPAGGTGG